MPVSRLSDDAASVELRGDAPGERSSLSLRHYLSVVRRRRWLVAAVLAASIGAGLATSFLQQPAYRATMKLVVGQEGGLPQVQFGQEVQTFTATMADLVRSTVVAETVLENLAIDDRTPEDLLKHVDVSINPETAVLRVAVEDRDPARAVEITREIGSVFSTLVRERFEPPAPVEGRDSVPPITVTIFDPAHAVPGRVSPRPLRNVALAGILGLALGLFAGFVREHFDRALRSREDIEQAFGVPVIGMVPFEPTEAEGGIAWTGPKAEAVRALRANLRYLGVQRPLRTLLVTSAGAQQGKTTVTANLAAAIARSGSTVVAIDADLRRPRLGFLLGAPKGAVGLTNALVGVADADGALLERVLPAQSDDGGRLLFLPSGPPPPNPTELLSSDEMRRVIDDLALAFDHVLVDSPPMLPVADALELARIVDGVILVVRRGYATSDEAREVRMVAQRLRIRLLGAVMTDASPPAGYGYADYREEDREPAPELSTTAGGGSEGFT